MGLDMYLSAKRYLGFGQDELASKVSELFPALGEARVKEVTAELMYWRKANAIHKWFVDNVQDGVDECQETWVEREKLEELLAVIEEVLADKKKAGELLPPSAGFFFGSTEIDDWYWQDLKETQTGLRDLLSKDLKGWDIYYRSSW